MCSSEVQVPSSLSGMCLLSIYVSVCMVCVSLKVIVCRCCVCVHGGRRVVSSSLHYPAAVCTTEWLVVIHYTASVFSGPTSSDAHSPISIDSHPTLEHISKFIVREVAADWKQVATSLSVEFSVISTAEIANRKCENACSDIFEQWLSWKTGTCTGRKKRTWNNVLSAVEEAGHKVFTQQLQTEVFHLQ